MLKIKLNNIVYSGESIEIIKGKLLVDGIDRGLITYECCCKTLQGTLDQSRGNEGILMWKEEAIVDE